MYIDAAFYHDLSKTNRSDHIPQGHDFFVLSAGYSQLLTLPQVNTEYLSRQDYQLIYVVGGPLHYYDKDGTEHIAPAESFLLFKPYEYQNYTLFKEDGCSFFWCHFGGILVEEILNNYKLANKRVVNVDSNPKFRKLFHLMRYNLMHKQPYYVEMCKLYLQELIISIARARKLKNANEQLPENLVCVIDYIHEHYYEKITVSQLAKIGTTNTKALSKQFAKYFGVSPLGYITNLRLQKAQTLLLQTNHKINEIALSVGFNDPLYFSNVFRKTFSISPREFRNQNNQS